MSDEVGRRDARVAAPARAAARRPSPRHIRVDRLTSLRNEQPGGAPHLGSTASFVLSNQPNGSSNEQRIAALRPLVAGWGDLWGVSQLDHKVSLRVSSRLRCSLGNYRASSLRITLAAWLIDDASPLLAEVLCHEAAHAVVHMTHGTFVKPHGPQWKDLMAKATMPVRARIPSSELPLAQQSAIQVSSVWQHRCPVCQATRFARTRIPRWRCRSCVEAGYTGELFVERVAGPVLVDG